MNNGYYSPDESAFWSGRERESEGCDHENMQTWAEGRGEAYECPDCGMRGSNTNSAMYGVSDADFV